MAKARGNPSTTWIWLADAVELVATAFQSSDVAKRIIREAKAAGKIRCRGLERGRKRDVDPGVNDPRFWQVPSSDVWLQIYWSDSRARRRVPALDRHRRARALCDYEVYAIEVVREDVIAALPAVAQARLVEMAPATATVEIPANSKTPVEAAQPSTPEPPKITARAWFKKALEEDHPQKQDELPREYAERLYPLMLAANLTKPWEFSGLLRRIQEAIKAAQKAPRPSATR